MPAHSNIQSLTHAGHACLQLSTRHGVAIVALQGAQLLAWTPSGHRDVLWLSPQSRPAPTAIRGGVPVCWPWFGKQGMPPGAMQHGPVRNRPWEVVSVQSDSQTCVSLTLAPRRATTPDDPLALYAAGLTASLQIDLGETLGQTLTTHNQGGQPFALTQALHSYFAVQDATRVQVAELAGLRYDDKLSGAVDQVHAGAFMLDRACDRVYQHPTASPTRTNHRYTLEDPAWQRRIHIETQGSQSLVVWNPGLEQARSMADVPETEWSAFLCVEAANAGADHVMLAPGAQHQLIQTLAVTRWPVRHP